MDIIIAVITLWAFLIVIIAYVDIKMSVALYVSYLILVPYLQFNIAELSFSYNLVNSLLLLSFIYYFKVKRRIPFYFRAISPFVFLHLSLLVLSVFAEDMPWSIQFNYWRISFMKTCIVSFIIWNIGLYDSKMLVYVKRALLISVVIAGIYGMFLMGWGGVNPYTSFLAGYFGGMDAAGIYTPLSSRLSFSTAGKIQSTMDHPMLYALILCFLIIVVLIETFKEKKRVYSLLLALLGFNLLISGVRTGIAALIIGFSYYFIKNRRIKVVVYGLIVVSVSYFVIVSNDDLSAIFTSFVDVSGGPSDVEGSSISMRLGQLQGTIDEITHSGFLSGKGYGWTSYYEVMQGDHPTIGAFESLIYYVLLNSGLIGALCWIIFFYLLFRLNRYYVKKKEEIVLIDTFVIVYAAYAIGTGEYGYLAFFSIIYTYLLLYLILGQNEMPKCDNL